MKKKTILPITLGTLLILGSMPIIFTQQKESQKVSAYVTSSLPFTIDLNDTSESNIRNYYSSLIGMSSSELQGNNLLKNLKTILKNGQKYYSYDSGNAIWNIYEIADRDWELSPASGTIYGTYNANTNKITGYSYGSGKNNPYIHALYINRNVTNEVKAWGNHNQDQWGINREHIWAKSHGFEGEAAGGARGDPMHLWAANGYANNIHSNYFYGFVDTSKSYTDCGNTYSNQSGNLRGTSLNKGSGTVFEPQDCDKGDIARSIFYMAARYNYFSGSDSDGIDSDNPNLVLVDTSTDSNGNTSYTSTTSNAGEMGVLRDLLAWNRLDPPDEYEIHRNNLLYTNYTNNRNPFVDFPEWAEYIWGTSTLANNNRNITSYSSTSTGSANPTTDILNGFGASEAVNVTGVSLNKNSTSIFAGDTETLIASVTPNNATNKTVSWTSSDTNIATVSDLGVVTAVAAGEATITVTTNDGGFTDTCLVTVTADSSGDVISDSIAAVSGSLSGWTATGTGSAYADGSVKLDSSGDNVKKLDIFTSEQASQMSSLTVTINGKINGTDNTNNAFKVEALSSNGTTLASKTFTGLIGTSYDDLVFTFNSDLTGCTGIRVTYLTKSSGNWGIKSISWEAVLSAESISEPTSIAATVDKHFKVGETITKSDITVTDDLSNVIDDFDFENYTFTYADAASGGALTNKIFNINYKTYDLDAELTVGVYRESYVPNVDTLDREATGVSGNSYVAWSDISDASNAVYAGKTAGGNSSIQLNNNETHYPAIVSTTSGGNIRKVEVEWNAATIAGRVLNVYGKNTAYSANTDLYNDSTDGDLIGTIVCGTSNELEITSDYAYVGVRSNASAIYLTSISFTYDVTPTKLSNFIMYEDNNNQCVSKFALAESYFEDMTSSNRSTFMTSNTYVIKTARERFIAWAINQGKIINYFDGDYVVADSRYIPDFNNKIINDNSYILIIVISIISISAFGVYFLLKRKEN